MLTVIKTVTTSWDTIFDISVFGYYGIYLAEQSENECKGSILLLENGDIGSSQTSIQYSSGIYLISYLVRNLPVTFYFDNCQERTYEIQKTVDNYLQVRIIDGTDISISFTLLSFVSRLNKLDIIPRSNDFNKISYKRLATNVFPKATYALAKCVSYMDITNTSYTILILDKNNHQILGETTFTNTTESIQDLGVLSNLPNDTTQIEISAKVIGNGKAYLESLTIYYN